jgi:DNA-binding MarR family transcriptional regulator
VKRQQWAKDRRVVRIVLTSKGRRLVNQISPIHAGDIDAALSFLPADQLLALDQLLSTLSDGLRASAAKQRQPRPLRK